MLDRYHSVNANNITKTLKILETCLSPFLSECLNGILVVATYSWLFKVTGTLHVLCF